jgi:hypothetical protein
VAVFPVAGFQGAVFPGLVFPGLVFPGLVFPVEVLRGAVAVQVGDRPERTGRDDDA